MKVIDEQPKKQIHVVEVFCGTKSFSKACEKKGWEVFTVDSKKRFKPTLCMDVMDWDYKAHAPPDVLWMGGAVHFVFDCIV